MFHPYNIFSWFAAISLCYTILAYTIDDIKVDENVNLWDNIFTSLKYIKHKIIWGTIIFLIISRGIVPNYSDILYYYMINVLSFSKQTIGILSLVGFCTAILGSFIYSCLLRKMEYPKTMIIAHIVIASSVIPTYLLVSRISNKTLGINDILFAIMSEALLKALFVAFINMPSLVVQTKITPKNVEATIYSMFRTISNLTSDFISPMIGGIIASSFHVSTKTFKHMTSILVVQFILSLIPILFIWLLPTNDEITEFSDKLHELETESENLYPSTPYSDEDFGHNSDEFDINYSSVIRVR